MPLPVGTSTSAYPSGWQVCFPTYQDLNIFCHYFHLCWDFFPHSLHHTTPHGYIKRSTNCRAISCCSTRKITGSSVRVLTEWQSTIPSVILGCWQGRKLSPLLISSKMDVRRLDVKFIINSKHCTPPMKKKMFQYQKDIFVVTIT